MASPGEMSGGGVSLGSFIQKYSDVIIAFTLVMIVIMMIIPLPTALLDLLICLNITIALIVIMSAIYNEEALDLSVFPSLLLVTTLFRLALNISSTRLILINGYAGEVITAFGNFVVGGRRLHHVYHLGHHQLHRHYERFRTRGGSFGAFHIGRDAR